MRYYNKGARYKSSSFTFSHSYYTIPLYAPVFGCNVECRNLIIFVDVIYNIVVSGWLFSGRLTFHLQRFDIVGWMQGMHPSCNLHLSNSLQRFSWNLGDLRLVAIFWHYLRMMYGMFVCTVGMFCTVAPRLFSEMHGWINSNNTNANVWCCHRRRATARVHPVYLMNVEWLQSAIDPQTKPNGAKSLHPPSLFIINTQPESWYLFYRPTEGRRLSQPGWLVTYRDGLPANRRSSILVLTRSDVVQLCWSRPTHYHWAKPLMYSNRLWFCFHSSYSNGTYGAYVMLLWTNITCICCRCNAGNWT